MASMVVLTILCSINYMMALMTGMSMSLHGLKAVGSMMSIMALTTEKGSDTHHDLADCDVYSVYDRLDD